MIGLFEGSVLKVVDSFIAVCCFYCCVKTCSLVLDEKSAYPFANLELNFYTNAIVPSFWTEFF